MAAALYTPAVLALATRLAAWPLDDTLTARAEARSRSCGSKLTLGLAFDAAGRVARVGVRAQACAVGQAAAAIFAEGARHRDGAAIERAHRALAAWLAGAGEPPDWPGLAAIAPARDYPGRHGAILLAWQAARDALSTAPAPG